MSRIRYDDATVARLKCAQPSPEIIEKLMILVEQLPDETNWLTVKKALMLELCPADRQLFSKRDDDTKKHPPFNQFEMSIRRAWVSAGGQQLMMPEHKKMEDVDPKCYL